MATAITSDVEVTVEAFFLDSESDPDHHRFAFAYRVRLKNHGSKTVQLLTRHWIITDSNGEVREVKGEGVVGKQPVLSAGEEFEYVSGSHLPTPVGTMEGTYQMTDDNGEHFDVEIPVFTLEVPGTMN